MSAQHTPGPFAVAQNSHRSMAVVLGPGMEHLAYVTGETTAQQLRDAKLFAAVPDLLSAARLAVEKLESLGLVGSVECKHIRAAIAKATTP